MTLQLLHFDGAMRRAQRQCLPLDMSRAFCVIVRQRGVSASSQLGTNEKEGGRVQLKARPLTHVRRGMRIEL
jgi:hypothetical protein